MEARDSREPAGFQHMDAAIDDWIALPPISRQGFEECGGNLSAVLPSEVDIGIEEHRLILYDIDWEIRLERASVLDCRNEAMIRHPLLAIVWHRTYHQPSISH